ncbi:AAA family ATPase [Streptomyces sp. Tue6028]|uniref:AAA family ATPase n=1 Tax=Streptomyces sp. Tue6028 TaxID=2036037 RepID=UPI003EC0BDD4
MEAAVTGSGPVVYLLVGLTGSGKTTYAKRRLESAGVVRLSVDERVHTRHGRYGVDYPERRYFELEAPVVAEIREELVALFAARQDTVLDYGLWLRSDREEWKKLVTQAGGRPKTLYFPVPSRSCCDALRSGTSARTATR